MANYNFANLSPYDFELLTRDLLRASQNVRLRAFAPGRDEGIDLRGWQAGRPNRRIIVQCKHMMGSTYASLRAAVRTEKTKLDNLRQKPARYILATTKLLTARNVDELFGILQPYCKTTEDIMDGGSIEDLLAEHEDVVRRYYKLWITSTPVLERILNAGIHNRSESYLQGLLLKSRNVCSVSCVG